ncbi:hypothetical protein [Streptomyces tremellae]|uniref:Uncharacterized protein n=1 Tax=Streptomyces tremellae TaxID=1124239 RepID=A0ABP7G5T1_9ACTN
MGLLNKITGRFRGPQWSRLPVPADSIRVVSLSPWNFGVRGVIPVSQARFTIYRREAWGHHVHTYPTTGRDGSTFTVVYSRVAHDDDLPGHELVTVYEFPTSV